MNLPEFENGGELTLKITDASLKLKSARLMTKVFPVVTFTFCEKEYFTPFPSVKGLQPQW